MNWHINSLVSLFLLLLINSTSFAQNQNLDKEALAVLIAKQLESGQLKQYGGKLFDKQGVLVGDKLSVLPDSGILTFQIPDTTALKPSVCLADACPKGNIPEKKVKPVVIGGNFSPIAKKDNNPAPKCTHTCRTRRSCPLGTKNPGDCTIDNIDCVYTCN